MIKVEVIKDFTLGKFEELKNIVRKNRDEKGRLFAGDTFECDQELCNYLTGNNAKKEVVVKVIEIIPEEIKPVITIIESEEAKDIAVDFYKNLSKKSAKKKKTSKK